MSTTETSSSTIARHGARRVLDDELRAAARAAARSSSRARAVELARDDGRPLGVGEHVAAPDVDVVLEPDRHRLRRRTAASSGPSTVSTAATRVRAARRQHDDLVAGAPDAAGDLRRRSRGSRGARRPSAGSPTAPGSGGRRGCGRRRSRSSRGARAASARRTTASRRRGRRRCRRGAPTSGSRARRAARAGATSACRSASISREALLREVDEVHLVDGDDDVRDREHRRDVASGAASARRRPCARRAGSRRRRRSRRR